jgi:prevent-host-death family protein
MLFDVHEAKTHFLKLVAAVEAGETVVICRNGKPIVECTPARSNVPFPFGGWAELTQAEYGVAHTDEDLLDGMGLMQLTRVAGTVSWRRMSFTNKRHRCATLRKRCRAPTGPG